MIFAKSFEQIIFLLSLSKLLNNNIISSIFKEIPNFFNPSDSSDIFILLVNYGSNIEYINQKLKSL